MERLFSVVPFTLLPFLVDPLVVPHSLLLLVFLWTPFNTSTTMVSSTPRDPWITSGTTSPFKSTHSLPRWLTLSNLWKQLVNKWSTLVLKSMLVSNNKKCVNNNKHAPLLRTQCPSHPCRPLSHLELSFALLALHSLLLARSEDNK